MRPRRRYAPSVSRDPTFLVLCVVLLATYIVSITVRVTRSLLMVYLYFQVDFRTLTYTSKLFCASTCTRISRQHSPRMLAGLPPTMSAAPMLTTRSPATLSAVSAALTFSTALYSPSGLDSKGTLILESSAWGRQKVWKKGKGKNKNERSIHVCIMRVYMATVTTSLDGP